MSVSEVKKGEEVSAQTKGVYIKTYGCQMNEYDSEKMYALLSDTHQPVASAENADVVIVNTCSVREKAEHKLYSLLGKLAILKKRRPELVVGVSGCVAQQEGSTILSRNRAVDFVIGTHNLSLVPSLVERAKEGHSPTVAIDYREEWEELPDDFNARPRFDESAEKANSSAFFSPVRAMVAIQRGCNKMCSFCIVPRTRGPQVSRDPKEVLKEIKLKARLGAKEVMLLGQTVNSYGMDLSPRFRFERLVREIADIEGIERIRFISPHPAEFRKEFIELYRDLPQLCPHIHLPLQSGNNRILKLMNRNYKRERYLDIVAQMREARPDIALSTDIIVGFPGETDEEYEETLDVMHQVKYAASFSFMYSVRPETAAQLKYEDSELVPKEVAHERLRRLQDLQEEHSHEFNKEFLGSKVDVLVESRSDKRVSFRGRLPENTPVELMVAEDEVLEIGSKVSVTVRRASPYGLRALTDQAEAQQVEA